jgi:hypothetical protein
LAPSAKVIATLTGTKPEMNESNMILIREGALLPPDFALESEAFLPGWRVVKNFDGYTLNRKIAQANWSFVRLTGEHRTRVVGRAYTGTLRKGIARILSGLRGKKFNSLEITVVGLKHFVGLAFLSISANRRHIQGGLRVTP